MRVEGWYLLLGGLMLLVAFVDSFVRRLPITTTLLYLAAGLALGPLGMGYISIDPVADAAFLERAAEIGVIVSLFTAGLKLRAPIRKHHWQVPIRLASISMCVTIGLITLTGVFLLGLPLGPSILLAAVLAPTDPVLASDVQLEHPYDRDQLRFGLTGEAGLNDGIAFPFVMLGLGLMGLHELGTMAWRWVAIDLLWAIFGGLGIGGLLGYATGHFMLYLRKRHKETLGRDEFLALGLIAFSYGVAIHLHAYGFLAVFAAGVAVRSVERHETGDEPPTKPTEIKQNLASRTSSSELDQAPTYMAGAVLGFNEQFERVLEIGLVLVIGGMISRAYFPAEAIWFSALLFLVIRPAAVLIGTVKSSLNKMKRGLISWFGIRGIGSLYYLMYAIEKGIPEKLASHLSGLVLSVMALSILVHGISVTPIMRIYENRKKFN